MMTTTEKKTATTEKTTASALRVSNLTFRYPDSSVDVLKGVNVELRPGEVLGFLGSNGSGKSTFLGAITNSLEGQRTGDVALAPTVRGPVGFATQSTGLYHHLSVRENLEHAARIASGKWNVTGPIDDAVEEYGLQPILATPARWLSGGQQRIAHIACSFVHQPTIRLLDEPTTALDFETRQRLIEVVRRWRDRSIATLVTAHYPEDVEELCTVLSVLVDGRATELGPISDYLGRKARMGILVSDQRSDPVALQGSLTTLAEITRSVYSSGVSCEDPIVSLEVRPPTLRDLLRSDPSLKFAADSEGVHQ